LAQDTRTLVPGAKQETDCYLTKRPNPAVWTYLSARRSFSIEIFDHRGKNSQTQNLYRRMNPMRKMLAIFLALSLTLVAAAVVSAGEMQLKVGDKVYACNCGEKCPCDSLSMRPSNCSCGKEMIQGTVAEVGDGTVMVQTEAWKRSFKTTGKFACNCGAGCNCNSVSQTPGKCACGKDLAEKMN
jgi:hypothetical protein